MTHSLGKCCYVDSCGPCPRDAVANSMCFYHAMMLSSMKEAKRRRPGTLRRLWWTLRDWF
jgi:hypothetical protein